jgi:hypothetical protein
VHSLASMSRSVYLGTFFRQIIAVLAHIRALIGKQTASLQCALIIARFVPCSMGPPRVRQHKAPSLCRPAFSVQQHTTKPFPIKHRLV